MTIQAKTSELGELDIGMSPLAFRGMLLRNNLANKDVQVTIERKKRSLKSNRFYFAGIVKPIAAALTECAGEKIKVNDAHELLKAKWGKVKMIVDPSSGEVHETGHTTRTMNQAEFETYIMECERFGSEILRIDWSGLDRQQIIDAHEFEFND